MDALLRIGLAAMLVIASVNCSAAATLTATPGQNGILQSEGRLVSPSGNFTMVMQNDGNLVVYHSHCVGNPACAAFNSATAQETSDYFLAMQEDGNLVVYKGKPGAEGGPVMSFCKARQRGSYFLIMQDDGNLVVYSGAGPANNFGPVWSSFHGCGDAKPTPARCYCALSFGGDVELKAGACGYADCSKQCYQTQGDQYKSSFCRGGTGACSAGCSP